MKLRKIGFLFACLLTFVALFTLAACDESTPPPPTECETHTFGEWETVQDPVCTEAGIETRFCTVCGYKEERTMTGSIGLSYTTYSGMICTITGIGLCEDTHICIPATIDGYSVVAIDANAFRSTNITSIQIPHSVKSIGNYAFAFCSSLTSITIPDNVTSIGDFVFEYCSSLTSITIPDSVTSISMWAFDNCYNLKTVYYGGTAKDWNAISIGGLNYNLTNATRYYYSETQPTATGNYWHYVDGVPTAW